jgi:hypothetical protein
MGVFTGGWGQILNFLEKIKFFGRQMVKMASFLI